MLVDVTDDGDVAQIPGQGATRDAVRRIDPDKSRARYVQQRLQISVDEPAVILVDIRLVTEAERRFPPGDVVIAGDGDDAAHPSRIPNERCGALKLARSRPLGEIAGNRHDVELTVLDDLLDCLDLLGDGRPAEVEIRDVE